MLVSVLEAWLLNSPLGTHSGMVVRGWCVVVYDYTIITYMNEITLAYISLDNFQAGNNHNVLSSSFREFRVARLLCCLCFQMSLSQLAFPGESENQKI